MSDKEDSETTKDRPRSSEPTEVEAAATEPAAAGGHDDGWIDIASVNQGIHQPGSGGTTDAAGYDSNGWFIADSFSFGVEREMAEVDPGLVADGDVGPETDGAQHIHIEMTELLVTNVSTGGSQGEAEYELEPVTVVNYGINGDGAVEPPPSDVDEPTLGPTAVSSDPAGDPTADETVSINFSEVEFQWRPSTEMVDLDTSGRLETASLADATDPLPTEGIGEGGLDELLDG